MLIGLERERHPATAAGLRTFTLTALLYFKPEPKGFSARITRPDMLSILQFGALSLVVLPTLPDRGFGPHGALNPYQIWLMVVLISGVSLAGYVALRLAGTRRGLLLTGLLGGLVSSTATTVTYARRVRDDPSQAHASALVILLAGARSPYAARSGFSRARPLCWSQSPCCSRPGAAGTAVALRQ
ncbi:MAG: DUF4010 domain-containing protein [Burkholderiaceae bacterium]|nr:DUF4010 domain-containing protein [Burkholderiaceae bacterium]